MLQVSSSYLYREVDDASVLEWLERLLPVAERLDLLPQTAAGLARLSGALYRRNRPRQALIVLRGTHELAVANGLVDVDRVTRTQLTWYEQFADPDAGLTMAREGLEIAGRRGSTAYGLLMVGNAVSCALRLGEWAWAMALLDEWLATEAAPQFQVELRADRAVLIALGGGDATGDLAQAERLVTTAKDPQFSSYIHWGRAWAALVAGRFAEARWEAATSVTVTAHFGPVSLPLAARAALWASDATDARELIDQIEASAVRGQALGLDLVTLRAGVAALEGARADAISGYREALRGWRSLGLVFDEALAALDMATLLAPTEREMSEVATVIQAARETLTRVGAQPLLARLEALPAVTTDPTPAGTSKRNASTSERQAGGDRRGGRRAGHRGGRRCPDARGRRERTATRPTAARE